MAIISLTTDFGLSDPYVGLMKAVILDICPDARIVDLTHAVPPQDVLAGAIALESTIGLFPQGSIHVAVVDPGVGGTRAPIAMRTRGGGVYVGPDNGLFTYVLAKEPSLLAVCLNRPQYHRQPVSHTFHGRDIFAPVAAHLANGVSLEQVGSPIVDLATIQIPQPVLEDDAMILHVVSIDRFGNLITYLTAAHFQQWASSWPDSSLTLTLPNQQIHQLSLTFSDVAAGQSLAYFGSSGRLEIAVRNANASERFNASVGTTLRLSRTRSDIV